MIGWRPATGDRLAPERDLSEILGVSRITLRRVSQLLENRGMITRMQGDGTYVAEPKIQRQAGQLVPFTRGMWRLSLNQEGQSIEYGKDLYRGDRFRFVTEMAPPETQAASTDPRSDRGGTARFAS